jgi:hypothetical protein
MIRMVWLALIGLISIAVVTGAKFISTPAGKSVSKIVEPFDEVDSAPLATKTDKLSTSNIDDDTLRNKLAVKTVKIIPQAPKEAAVEKSAPALQKHSQSAFARLRGRVHHASPRHKWFRRHG